MSTLAELGKEFQHEGHTYLVVRIVHSHTLFEDNGTQYTLEEHYAELHGAGGQIKFLNFGEPEKRPFERQSTMKGLDVQVWKRF